eukprot:281323-Chlamydomonas_euryale.AAC.2
MNVWQTGRCCPLSAHLPFFAAHACLQTTGKSDRWYYKLSMQMTEATAIGLRNTLASVDQLALIVRSAGVLCSSKVRLEIGGHVLFQQTPYTAYCLDPSYSNATCTRSI